MNEAFDFGWRCVAFFALVALDLAACVPLVLAGWAAVTVNPLFWMTTVPGVALALGASFAMFWAMDRIWDF